MRERDMRDRVQNFLRGTMRNVVMPASMGLGLALAGCGGSDEPLAKYMAPMFDAAADVPVQLDGPVAKYMGPMIDGGVDGGEGVDADVGPIAKYMGPMPSDAGPAPMYMAIQPDAAAKDSGPGPVLRYQAIQPDAAQIPIYAAPVPPAKV